MYLTMNLAGRSRLKAAVLMLISLVITISLSFSTAFSQDLGTGDNDESQGCTLLEYKLLLDLIYIHAIFGCIELNRLLRPESDPFNVQPTFDAIADDLQENTERRNELLDCLDGSESDDQAAICWEILVDEF